MNHVAAIERAMRRLSRGPHLSRLHRRLNTAAEVDLDRPAYIALACLADEGPMTLSALAEASSVDVSTMSRLVDRLGQAGHVEAQRLATDQRVVRLSLSPAGARLVERLRAVRHEALTRMLATWTPDEQATFAGLLVRFVAGIEQLAAPGPELARSGTLGGRRAPIDGDSQRATFPREDHE
jgi:DNA-binding MarR family transcriptional regulator